MDVDGLGADDVAEGSGSDEVVEEAPASGVEPGSDAVG